MARPTIARFDEQHQQAMDCACAGQLEVARRLLADLVPSASEPHLKAVLLNDLAVVDALGGDSKASESGFRAALAIAPTWHVAQTNLDLIRGRVVADLPDEQSKEVNPGDRTVEPDQIKVAIVSFLFNWPSTAGGIIHTVELTQFLECAGYRVQHFHAQNKTCEIGEIDSSLPIRSEAVPFAYPDSDPQQIQAAFRATIERFDPDHVIITDAWNFKPLLAEAVRGYPYILRQQSQECLCPLNNLRLLPSAAGGVMQCPLNQLASPAECNQCLNARGDQSGFFHKLERSLSGVGTAEYFDCLRRAFWDAEAVLVLNPQIESMLRPYCQSIRVVTWGMDPARFPWPLRDDRRPGSHKTLFMAGVVQESIKGFHVVHQACQILRQRRSDFRLLATGTPAGQVDEFTSFTGWLSQDELPAKIRAADILVMPTIAQEGLSRTSVEAMGVGRPVVASRIGGLPYTVTDGVTGLLFEAGDPVDLARKLEVLLDNPELCDRMGAPAEFDSTRTFAGRL